jgi:hypothetical protein
MNKGSTQLRISILPEAAAYYRTIPRTLQKRVISTILAAHAMKIDLNALLETRKVLVTCGSLLNQSLRTSWGKAVDHKALDEALRIIRGLTK